MYTSVVLLALTGFVAPSASRSEPQWLREYGTARQQGRAAEKPLAVFVGEGKAGWQQVSRDGRLDREVKRLLADNYVCLYVDTAKESGRRLAADLEIADGPGLVISSHSGALQAFRHEGELENGDLADYLRRYADPDHEVRTTETDRPARVSYYAPEPMQPAYPPMNMGMGFAPMFGGGGRGGC